MDSEVSQSSSPYRGSEWRSIHTSQPSRDAESTKMLKIHSLLNPTSGTEALHDNRPVTFAPTPKFSHSRPTPSPIAQRPKPATRFTTSRHSQVTKVEVTPKRGKIAKDQPVFTRGSVRSPMNYAPYETFTDTGELIAAQRTELVQQHARFNIHPSAEDGEGLIRDYVRHIPYSSDKKGFADKTVFQYTFIVPGDASKRIHTVMWDYQIGLVRITPFFKACDYSKTTPARAIEGNAGLKDLATSVTGGSIVAQGYWLPYACARALCATFCQEIRWALTPVFGPGFLNDCLPPTHGDFARFRIDPTIVRSSARQVQGWTAGAAPTRVTPAGPSESPRYLTDSPVAAVGRQHSRARRPRPTPQRSIGLNSRGTPTTTPDDDKDDNSGEEEEEGEKDEEEELAIREDSPLLSPKSKPPIPRSSGWTSINSPRPLAARREAGAMTAAAAVRAPETVTSSPSPFPLDPTNPFLPAAESGEKSKPLRAPIVLAYKSSSKSGSNRSSSNKNNARDGKRSMKRRQEEGGLQQEGETGEEEGAEREGRGTRRARGGSSESDEEDIIVPHHGPKRRATAREIRADEAAAAVVGWRPSFVPTDEKEQEDGNVGDNDGDDNNNGEAKIRRQAAMLLLEFSRTPRLFGIDGSRVAF